MMWLVIFLTLCAHIGNSCLKKTEKGNGQGKGKGDLLSASYHFVKFSGLAMTSVVSKVCNNPNSGMEDGLVRLRFRSKKFKFHEEDETFICDQGAEKFESASSENV